MSKVRSLYLVLLFAGCAAVPATTHVSHISMIAIADADNEIERPALKDDFKKDTGAAPIAEDAKPVGVVDVDTRKDCGPCRRLKKDAESYKGLKFVFHEVESATVPVLKWTVNGVRHQQVGYTTMAEFVKVYNASLKPKKRDKIAGVYYDRNRHRYNWSWEGELRRHLCEPPHNLSWDSVSGWSEWQCVTWHDQWHEEHGRG